MTLRTYTILAILAAVSLLSPVKTTYGQSVAEKIKSDNLLVNGNFEKGKAGWSEDWSWADLDASMRIVGAQDALAGTGALELTCTRYGTGRTQIRTNAFTVREGKAYKVSFDARANGVSKLQAVMRMIPGPWTVHFSKTFSLLPQWQRFEMVGIPSSRIKHPDKTALYFDFKGVGTIWLDDVSVTEIDLPKTTPRNTGNLVPNSSFEVDTTIDNWLYDVRNPRFRWQIDATTASRGKRSIQGSGKLSSACIKLRPFVPHSLSMDLKSDKPTRTTIRLMGRRFNPILEKKVDLTTDWKRYFVSGSSKIAIDNQYYVTVENTNGRLLWVDGVCLSEGSDGKDYQPSASIEASAVVVPDVSKVFKQGQPVQIKLRLANNDWNHEKDKSEKVPYTWTLKDIYGHIEATGKGQATAENPATTLSLSPKRLGMYRIEITPAGGKTNEDIFAVVHCRNTPPNPKSPFGAHFQLQPVPLDMMKKLGIAKGRCHWPPTVTQWTCVERNKGTFRFNDGFVKKATKNGIRLLGSIAGTPAWAHNGEKTSIYITQYPKNLDDWRNYVRQTVQHYPEIREWEIFNEPELEIFFRGTKEQFITLYTSAAEEIKKIDPTLKIVGFGNANKERMVPSYLVPLKQHDALKYLSAISVHLYSSGAKSKILIDRMKELLGGMRAFLDQTGHPDVEIWDTESGGSSISFRRAWRRTQHEGESLDRLCFNAIGEFFKMNVAKLNLGVSRIYIYIIEGSPDIEQAFSYTLLDVDRGPRPIIPAFSTLVHFFESAKPMGIISAGDKNLVVYAFQRGDEDILVLWAKSETHTKSIHFGNVKINVYDALGNTYPMKNGAITITSQPLIFVIPHPQLNQFMAKLR